MSEEIKEAISTLKFLVCAIKSDTTPPCGCDKEGVASIILSVAEKLESVNQDGRSSQ